MAGKRRVDPTKIRAVLRYLREHPWSSRDEIAFGCGIASQTLSGIIKNELNLRSEQHEAAGGGPSRTVFALPEVKC